MDIAIIGTGNVGRALGTSFIKAGHAVTFSSTDVAATAVVAAELGGRAAASNVEAVRGVDVVVLAVPFAASGEAVAREIAEAAAGKVVIDVSNPLKATYDGLVTENGPSAAERLQAWLTGASVVKAFNTLFAASQAAPVRDGVRLDGFVAGDDPAAKAIALELAGSIGLRPIDAGPLARARELEALAWLNISLQLGFGGEWQTAVVVLDPPAAAVAA